MTSDLTNKKTLDDPELIKVVARAFLNHYITPSFERAHEKTALTQAKKAIKAVKYYLAQSE